MLPIRILQVFTIMNRGGAESMIMNYYRAIDRTKVQFDFLVHRKEPAAFDDEIIQLGGRIFKFEAINPLFPQPYYKQLRMFFKTHNQYTIVHSHLNTFSSFPLKIAKEFNIPCRIAHAHIAIDSVSWSSLFRSKEQFKETFKKLIKLQLKKRVKTHASHLFSCGNKAGQWLFGETPFKTMNNAIPSDIFKYNPLVEDQYKKKFKLEDALVLGHIGRFVSQKNHGFLLKIFVALLKKQPQAVLVLIGDGPLKNDIEQEAKTLGVYANIRFLGVRTDIPQLCQMMDVFVFPSFYEGLPVTLIEAQASGMSVLASNTITNEVKITNALQFMSIENPPESWAEKIMEMLNKRPIKRNTKEVIMESGYDIISNTETLKTFYLNNIPH